VTQSQLDRAIALQTGESLCLVRAHGFSLVNVTIRPTEPEHIELRLDCPFCRYSNSMPSERDTLATCSRCDVEFEFSEEELYVAGARVAVATQAA
jgi:hypothetical protein